MRARKEDARERLFRLGAEALTDLE
ncbi:hypothetical protein, partial [Corallococcus soli]